MPRRKAHWKQAPYHPLVDRLKVGDVVLWGGRKKPRTIRAVLYMQTDHLYSLCFVKQVYSRYPGSLVTYNRYEAIKNMRAIVAEDVDLCKVDVECELTSAVTEYNEQLQRAWDTGDFSTFTNWLKRNGFTGRPNPLDPGQHKTVGVIY